MSSSASSSRCTRRLRRLHIEPLEDRSLLSAVVGDAFLASDPPQLDWERTVLNGSDGGLYAVHLSQGSGMAPRELGSTGVVMSDVAFHPDGALYGVDFTTAPLRLTSFTSSLYEIVVDDYKDPASVATAGEQEIETADGERITLNALEFRGDRLFAAGYDLGSYDDQALRYDHWIYQIDVPTGVAQRFAPLLVGDEAYESGGAIQFDTSGNLFVTTTQGALLKVDVQTQSPTASVLRETGYGDFYALTRLTPPAMYGYRAWSGSPGSDLTQVSNVLGDAQQDYFTITLDEVVYGASTFLPDAAPVATDDEFRMNAGTGLVIVAPGVLANDEAGGQGGSLTAMLETDVSDGTLMLNLDGSFSYLPGDQFTGTDSFSYVANNGRRDSNVATVTITVNTPPTAAGDAYAAQEDTLLVVPAVDGVLANDEDTDGDTLSAVLVSEPSHGTLTLESDGSFRYQPAVNYNREHGPESFTYKATDGVADTEVVTVTIDVAPINDRPWPNSNWYTYNRAANDTLSVTVDSGVLSDDTDVEGDPLEARLESGPSHGTLVLDPDGSFSYTADPGFSGTDSFSYKAHDGLQHSLDPATVTIDVNTPPAAVADSYHYVVGQAATLSVPAESGVLANDVDMELNTLRAVQIEAPDNGTLKFNLDGSFDYTPTGGFLGTDTFVYVARDEHLESAATTVSIHVQQPSPPVAFPDEYAYTVGEDVVLTLAAESGVLANDEDAQDDELSAQLVDAPSHGTVTLNTDGSFTYTPHAGFSGEDSFTYQADDGMLLSEPTTVTIWVNTVPVAGDNQYAVGQGDTLTVPVASGLLADDSDAEGDLLSAVLDVEPSHGTLALAADGSFTYTPDADFLGLDHFTYRAHDGLADSNVATVEVTVRSGSMSLVGTEGDDVFEFVAGATPEAWVVKINGEVQPVAATVLEVDFDGLGGHDTALLTGIGGNDLLELWPDHGTLRAWNSTYSVSVVNIEAVNAEGLGGEDQAVLHDSTGDDALTLWPSGGLLVAPAARHMANGFENVLALATDGHDVARLYDSPGADVLVTSPTYANLSGEGFELQAEHFDATHTFSTAGGFDQAKMFDSVGDDRFYTGPAEGALSGDGFYNRAKGFKQVHAYGTAGGYDKAELFDSASDDDFFGSPLEGALWGEGFYYRAKHFEAVYAYATEGGHDTAELHDSAANDLFVSTPNYGEITGGGFYNRAQHFEDIYAHADQGGFDVAKMFDSPGDDLYVTAPTYGALSGEGFFNRANHFDQVHAYANAGGFDVAKMFDSDGDDSFYGSPVEGSLFGTGFYNRAKSFEQVHAYAEAGGIDRADLYDSPGGDTFAGSTLDGALYGDGFYNRAKHFRKTNVHSTAGGEDQALLYDDPVVDDGYTLRIVGPQSEFARVAWLYDFERCFTSTEPPGSDVVERAVDAVLSTYWRHDSA